MNQNNIEKYFEKFTVEDLKDAEFKIVDSEKNLAKIKKTKYVGLIEHIFYLNENKFAAVADIFPPINNNFQELILDDKPFKGIIVNISNMKFVDKSPKYLNNSKFIDTKTIYHKKYSEFENTYFKIKDKSNKSYGKSIKKCEINQHCEAFQFTDNILTNSHFYVKISDIEVIENLQDIIEYHNQVIIKPSNILEFEPNEYEDFKINDMVTFVDSKSHTYRGQLVWLGKLNENDAAIISLAENVTEPDMAIKLDRIIMKNKFNIDTFGIIVGIFVLKNDSIPYIKLREVNLEVVDQKYKYSFLKESFNEKIILFNVNGVQMIATLKWKGSIYNEMSIGCEMNQELSDGSNGTYGTEKLFHCANKKGILITWSKSKFQNVHLCEFGLNHKNLETISTKFGFDIYDVNTICCIEKLDKVDSEQNLKIGCKILFQNKDIGPCLFIGKVNGVLSIGIALEPDSINKNQSIIDFINFYAFKQKKICLLDFKTIKIGTFYENINSGQCCLFKEINYYPEHGKCLHGVLKWQGKHENGKDVCGIELKEEIKEYCSEYFLENLFEHNDGYGVIDDENKIEFFGFLETGNNLLNKEILKDEIIKCLLNNDSKMKILDFLNDLCSCYAKEFISFLKENKELLTTQSFPSIISSLFARNKNDEINLLLSIDDTKSLISSLSSLFSSFLNEFDVSFFDFILTYISPPDNDNDEFCLQLALRCLESMSKKNNSNESDNKFKSLYNKAIGKCTNLNCLINKDDNTMETFITEIIINESVSDEIIIEILKSKKFDIDKTNSMNQSPLELSIDKLRPEILSELFQLNCNIDKLRSFQKKILQLPKEHGNLETRYEVLCLISKRLDHLSCEIPTPMGIF